MVNKVNSVLQVGRMAELEAIDLVRKILDDQDRYQRGDIAELAQKLEYIPLALTQAVAYIWEKGCPIQRYLALYEKSRVNALILLGHSATNSLAEDEARNAVTTTWMMSFTQIKDQNTLAADILSLLAFLDRHCIPDELIRRRDPSLSDMDFEEACGLLKGFSLIEEIPLTLRGESHAAFSLHRMVQLVTQEWLKFYGETAVWAEKALVAVSIVFPPGEREEWKSCEIYLPHVKVVLDSKVQSEDGSVSTSKAALLHNAATYFRVKGYHGRAEETACEAVAARQASVGPKHPDTLASHTSLSRVLFEQGRIEAAMELQLKAVKAAGSSIPEDHPDMLRAVAHLAALHGIQGRCVEAERLQKHVLELGEPKLGQDHPDVLLTMRDLAVTYGHLGRYDEAEKLNQLVLERRTRVLGDDHPETLISMLDLAATYMRQNSVLKAKLAEEKERKVIEARVKVLGKEHPATIQAMEHLRDTYEWQGRHDDAVKLQEQIRAINRKGNGQTAELSDAEKLNMSRNIMTYELPIHSNRIRRMSHDEDLVVETTTEEEQEAEGGPQLRATRSWVDLNHAVNVDDTTNTEQVGTRVPNTNPGHRHTQSMSTSASLLSSANNIPARDQTKRTRSSVGGFRSRFKSWQGESGEQSGKSEEKSWNKSWFPRR
jgi:tetratricopeptide (TPR) repeat protein